jgi:hypothetical protein
VGLISVNVDPLPACRVAPAGMNVLKGTPVITVGCSGGEKPTVQSFKITALNRYLGADNIEVGGMPAQGRSGGGLFTKDGQLIGVCSGADSHYREGLYAGLKTVQAILDRCQLANLYRSAGSAGREQNRLADDPAAALANLDQADAEPSIDAVVEPAETRQGATTLTTKTEPRGRQPVAARDDAGDEVAIREALEQAGEAEIVCIIRPVNQPRAASRVVILNRASRRFVEYLSDEMDTQPDIRETTLTAKAPRKMASVQKVERQTTSNPHGSSDKAAAASEEDRPQPTGPQPYRRNRPERPLATAAR